MSQNLNTMVYYLQATEKLEILMGQVPAEMQVQLPLWDPYLLPLDPPLLQYNEWQKRTS